MPGRDCYAHRCGFRVLATACPQSASAVSLSCPSFSAAANLAQLCKLALCMIRAPGSYRSSRSVAAAFRSGTLWPAGRARDRPRETHPDDYAGDGAHGGHYRDLADLPSPGALPLGQVPKFRAGRAGRQPEGPGAPPSPRGFERWPQRYGSGWAPWSADLPAPRGVQRPKPLAPRTPRQRHAGLDLPARRHSQILHQPFVNPTLSPWRRGNKC